MSRIILPHPVISKRLPTRLDYTEKILYYGIDNLYPQKQEQLRLRSPLIKSATELLEDFINGSGLELNGSAIINDEADTTTDLLNIIARDYAKFNGFAIHVNFNGLTQITSLTHIPFEYCRLGIPDITGKVHSVVVSNNWEQDSEKLPTRGRIISRIYPIYNPKKALENLLSNDASGQVLYFTGIEKDKYPLSTFDAIEATGESDEAMQIYERNNIKKGFHGSTIFKYPGKIETDEEEAEVRKLVASWNGEDSPGVTVAQVEEDFSGTLLETIASNSNDTLFDSTLDSVLERILQNFRIPPALMGVAPEGGVFTQLAYLESFTVYNVVTRNRRDMVARVLNNLTNRWAEGGFLVGRILENKFEIQGDSTQVVSDKITETPQEDGS